MVAGTNVFIDALPAGDNLIGALPRVSATHWKIAGGNVGVDARLMRSGQLTWDKHTVAAEADVDLDAEAPPF